MHYYRSGKQLPSDETMVKIAEIAGLDPYEALLRLNIWRCEMKTLHAGKSLSQESALKVYASKLQEHLRRAAAIIIAALMLAGASLSPTPANAHARTSPAQADMQPGTNVYYGKFRRWLRGRRRRWKAA